MRTKKHLTDKEKTFFDKYLEWHISRLRKPTRNELAQYIKTSPQNCQYYINVLKEKGRIK